jgi:hypothetical protein
MTLRFKNQSTDNRIQTDFFVFPAGAVGIEPTQTVLETVVLPLYDTPGTAKQETDDSQQDEPIDSGFRTQLSVVWSLSPDHSYLLSLCGVCFRQNLQNLLRESFSFTFFLFRFVYVVMRLHSEHFILAMLSLIFPIVRSKI